MIAPQSPATVSFSVTVALMTVVITMGNLQLFSVYIQFSMFDLKLKKTVILMLWKTITNNRKQIKKNILKCLEQPILNRSPLNRNRVFVRSLNRLLELILLLKPLIIIIKADGGTHTKTSLDGSFLRRWFSYFALNSYLFHVLFTLNNITGNG